jgi:signal recognition particle receptor subunit beta
VADMAIKAAGAYGREDLSGRMERHRVHLADRSVRVIVVGEYKQGKSSFVNALLGAAVCPVDDDIATSVPTIVRHAEAPVAHAMIAGAGDTAVAREIPVGEIASYVTEGGDPERRRRVTRVEVGIPRRILKEGLVLVDTPGVGGLSAAHAAATTGMLPSADAVVFVSSAAQEYTGPELDFLRRTRDLCPRIVCVIAKIDFYPEWRAIRELNLGHLSRLGIEATVVVLSSPLRNRAVSQGDAGLNAESGFPTLDAALRGHMEDIAHRRTREVADEVLWMTDQLEAPFRAERASLTEPDRGGDLVGRLQEARAAAQALKDSSAGWQTLLSDGFADLNADVDYDLRTRFRTLVDEADPMIDSGDPAKEWDDIGAWLEKRLAEDVAENFTLMTRRARELTELVAERFGRQEVDVPLSASVGVPVARLGELAVREGPQGGTGLPGQGLVALRGAYGGMLMAGVFAQLVGVAGVIVNPILGVVGILLAGKAVREQRQRELAGRRQQAKATVRRYIDDAAHAIGKESRDALRRIQRDLRDGLTERANEILRSSNESLKAAEAAVTTDAGERARRLADVDAELGRLSALRSRATAVMDLTKGAARQEAAG